MSILIVVLAVTGSALAQVQVPCYGEGCANVTVYLGPRWGSRVIVIPRLNISQGVSEGSGDDENEIPNPRYKPIPPAQEVSKGLEDDVPEIPSWKIRYKPIPQGELRVDLEESTKQTTRNYNYWSWTKRPERYPWQTTGRPEWDEQPTTQRPGMRNFQNRYYWWNTRRPYPWQSTGRFEKSWTTTGRPWNRESTNQPVDSLVDARGTLDLSYRGYTGEDVKRVLKNLSEHDRSRVKQLLLDHNRITYLPAMVFPVEFEYSLRELSLNNNPDISPPYLGSTSFLELSRLTHLRVLNMTNCGMMSFTVPYFPYLVALDLSHNQLSSLPYGLDRLTTLNHLYLKDNMITYVDNQPLSSLIDLRTLDLQRNGLKYISGQPLERLYYLTVLNLNDNLLTSLPLLEAGFTRFVSLNNNSLECNCDLLVWLQHQDLQIDYYGRCHNTGYGNFLIDIKNSPQEYKYLCEENGWLKSEVIKPATLWYKHNPDIMSVVYKVVGVMIVLLVLGLLLKRRRKIKVEPKGIPYNILDNKCVSTVSGPHVEV